jgi:hypothetical protein
MTSLLGAILREGNIPVEERCKYFPKISLDPGMLLDVTLQIMDRPDNFPATQADPAYSSK